MRERAILAGAALAAALAFPVMAQAPAWSTGAYAPGNASANLGNGQYVTKALAVDAAGNSFVTGSTLVSGTSAFLTTKVTPSGAIAWQKTWATGDSRAAAATAVATDAAGNAFVAGSVAMPNGTGDVKLVKHAAADGAILWQTRYDGGRDDQAYEIVVDASQNVIVAAESINAAGNADIRILKFSGADGTLLWQRAYDGGREDYVNDIALDASGNVVVAGVSMNAAGNTDVRVLKLAGASGAIQWQQSYDGGGDDQAYGLALDASGNAVITGFSMAGGRATALAMKLAGADGRVLWRKALDAGRGDYGQAVAIDSSGDAAVAIQSVNANGNFDFRTVKLASADGAVLWDRSYDSGGDDFAYHIALDASGNAVTVGSSVVSTGDTDWKIVRHAAAAGEILEQATFSGAAGTKDDAFAAAAVSGGIVVAGISHDAGTLQAVRVARYNSAAPGGALNAPVAASPTGAVTSLTPTFLWNASPGATGYKLLVKTSSATVVNVSLTLAQALCPKNTGVCGYAPSAALAAGTAHSWQVAATNSTVTSAYSAPLSFTTPGAAAPAAPAGASPSGAIAALTPALLWTPSPGATGYNVRVQANGSTVASASLTLSQSGCPKNSGACAYTVATPLAAGTTFTWQVNATNAAGTSGWSAPLSFTTPGSGAVPPVPVPGAPNGTTASTTPTLMWNASPGATTYTARVMGSGGAVVASAMLTLSQASCPRNTGACAYTVPAALAPATGYSWQVQAGNAAGASAFSAPMAFTTP